MAALAGGPRRCGPRRRLIDFGCDDRFVSGPCSSCRVRSIVWCGGKRKTPPQPEGRGIVGLSASPSTGSGQALRQAPRRARDKPLDRLGTSSGQGIRFAESCFFYVRVFAFRIWPRSQGVAVKGKHPPEADTAGACPYKGGCTALGYAAGGRAPRGRWRTKARGAEHRWRPEGRRYGIWGRRRRTDLKVCLYGVAQNMGRSIPPSHPERFVNLGVAPRPPGRAGLCGGGPMYPSSRASRPYW